jgi:cation transport regulator ChaB
MTIRTLVAILAVAAISCAIASGETVVKTGDGGVSVSVSVSSAESTPHGSGGGWLGVRISPVPAPLAAHLKSKSIGAMVANLVKGSPAHTAGIKQYDVIVGLGDDAIKDGPGLIKAVSSRKAGDKIKLWVMRKGEKTQIPAVLGKPVPADKAQLVHKEDFPGAGNVWKDVTRLHPQIMLRKKAGDWEKMDGKDLPEEIRKMLKAIPKNIAPGANSNSSVSMKTVIHTKDSNGTDVRIEQDETGKITVCRKQRDDDGNEAVDTKTYKDREQLRLSDQEASDLLKKSHVQVFTSIKPGQMEKRPKGDMPEIRLFTGGDHAKLNKEIREKILKSIEKMDLPEDVKKQLQKQLQINIRIQGDKDAAEDDKPGDPKPKARPKDRKAKKTPKKDRKPKDEKTSDAHV